jgi:hypothetical protein
VHATKPGTTACGFLAGAAQAAAAAIGASEHFSPTLKYILFCLLPHTIIKAVKKSQLCYGDDCSRTTLLAQAQHL